MIKYIGQHIVDFIARFRSDVYLENIADGTVDGDKFLGLDSNNKIVKETASTAVTNLTAAGVSGSNNNILTDKGDGTIQSEITFTYDASLFTAGISGYMSDKPRFELTNVNTDPTYKSTIRFVKDAADVENDEHLGAIDFYGDNDAGTPEQINYSKIISTIANKVDTDEAGKLSIQVTTSNGTTSALQDAFVATGNATSNVVNVTLGGGANPIESTTFASGVLHANNSHQQFTLDGGTDPMMTFLSQEDTGDMFTITTTTHGATRLVTTDDDASAAHFEIEADGNITLDAQGSVVLESQASTLTWGTNGDLDLVSNATGDPTIRLTSTAGSTHVGGELSFVTDEGAAGASGDVLGRITFIGDNADQDTPQQTYAKIQGKVDVATDGEESGILELQVANHDDDLGTGLILTGGSQNDEIDVTIGLGSASVVTIPGFISIGGHAIDDIQVAGDTFADVDDQLMSAAAINDLIGASGGGGSVTVADSNTDTAFPVVFHDESNNLLDDTSGFTYNPNTGTVNIPSALTLDGGLFSYASQTLTMASTSSDEPIITLVNSNADATPPVLAFQKTDTGADGDDLGGIKFIGDDDGGVVTDYCQVLGEIKESANGSEEGRLSIKVANSTGLQDIIVATGLSGASIPKRHFAIPSDGAGNADGDVVYIGTGSTVIGKIYYYAANGTWQLTNSDDPSTATGWLAVALGTDPDVDGMLVRGTVDLAEDIVGTEALGSIIYLDKATTGAATTAAPTATGDIVRVIGYALTTGNENKIWFSPDNTWVEHV